MAEVIECSPNALAAYVPCINCASERQLMGAIAVLLCKIVGQAGRANVECDPAVLIESYKCYSCMSDSQMLQGIVKLLVNWLLVNIEAENEMDILHDISCMNCLNPKSIRGIIMGLLCEGVTHGTILCDSNPV